ncbi:KamA family radical SAM protein [Oleispirillum naphthae]|uniref:KamA family radical SAM protein n=1 Tax=Oleispirillum naphthae TaxID=2838853 RepID=UPI003082408B
MSTPRALPESLTPHLRALAARSPAVARQFVAAAEESMASPFDLADPIGDAAKSPLPGLVHRYPDRVLLLPTMACAAHCRFCFRRDRLGEGRMTAAEIAAALDYVAARPQIHEVILSGGDPLTLPAAELAALLARIDAIPSVEVARLHTRLPVHDPARARRAAAALAAGRAARWVAVHVNHADELTAETRAALAALRGAGCFLVSQTVLLAGVNDSVETLSALFRALVALGVKPYYLHHPDRAAGTEHFRVPLARGREIMESLRGGLSGLALPAYILDIPGGHGKVWATDAFVAPAADGGWNVRAPDGSLHPYPADAPAATTVAPDGAK